MLWTLKGLFEHANSVRKNFGGKWVPARPLSGGLRWRMRAAWMVLTGKADAFIWPEGQ